MSSTGRPSATHPSPLLLVLETATSRGSVALMAGDGCLAEFSLRSTLTHSRRLLGAIEFLLQESGVTWPDLDAVAVSLGPGSFTGLRIGLSTAKGLALATGVPLIGVPTLDGLAAQFTFTTPLICPLLDARKKEVYAAFFRCADGGLPRRESEYLVLPPDRLADMVAAPTIFIGDGAECYGDLLVRQLGDLALLPPAAIYLPRAAALGRLALARWRAGEFLEPGPAGPIYVRASEAEVNFGGKMG